MHPFQFLNFFTVFSSFIFYCFKLLKVVFSHSSEPFAACCPRPNFCCEFGQLRFDFAYLDLNLENACSALLNFF